MPPHECEFRLCSCRRKSEDQFAEWKQENFCARYPPRRAAVVIVYSIGLIRPKEFREILNVRRTEFIWAVTAFGSVALLGTLKGIVVAINVSLIALAYQVADPPFMFWTQARNECVSAKVEGTSRRRQLSRIVVAEARRASFFSPTPSTFGRR